MITLYSGLMGSEKSYQLIKRYIEYSLKQKCLITAPDNSYVTSRKENLKIDVDFITNSQYPDKILQEWLNSKEDYSHIFIDEVQFFHPSFFDVIMEINNNYNVHIHLSGLLRDFRNELFGCTYKFLEIANNIIENPVPCRYYKCSEIATHMKKISENLELPKDNVFISVCEEHWKAKVMIEV